MSTTTDKPRLVVPDKSFFVKERSSLYNQWLISWWRENMQNSVDAGAKTIRIDISDAAPKGSFGREPDPGGVTRVVFADDGIGMDAPTIDNVFFRMGATTKDDETSVGGFGRARIMTCFSQVRYSIETRDRYVEGDGPEFLNFSRSEAIDALERWQQASSDRATAAGAKTALNRDATDAIAADRARLVSASSFAGCRLEVDLPPDERDRNGHRSTPEGMLNTLQVYLAQSDLKCEVIINGESYQKPSVKYAKRKALYATIGKDAIDQSWIANRRIETKLRPDGDYDVKFATVRIIPSEDAPQGTREKLIFRVHGASMFSEYTSVNAGLFLEIEPAIARQVLTANRDGLKEPFSSAVEDYKRLLATDAQQATKGDSGPEFTLLPGGLGRKIARRRLKEDDLTTAEAEAITGEAGRTLARIATSPIGMLLGRGATSRPAISKGSIPIFSNPSSKRSPLPATLPGPSWRTSSNAPKRRASRLLSRTPGHTEPWCSPPAICSASSSTIWHCRRRQRTSSPGRPTRTGCRILTTFRS
jgi:Histidine kinase-, DNA gyrase B-, and HSP90-like ATPase